MNTLHITRRSFLKTCGVLGGATLLNAGLPALVRAANEKTLKDYMNDRISAVYGADGKFPIRASQDNPQVKALYKNWLGEPGSEKAHQFLHMHFTDRSQNIKRLGDKAVNPRAKEFEGQPYPYE
ncbi:MAG: iron hydrogenase small subunit [Desulfovibrio aminophilus]|uniref:iron hydrogenase small subunit n=1 Tax=Desulfovibrio aminophilus TaxID=81425 RepID=UPI0039EAD4F2